MKHFAFIQKTRDRKGRIQSFLLRQIVDSEQDFTEDEKIYEVIITREKNCKDLRSIKRTNDESKKDKFGLVGFIMHNRQETFMDMVKKDLEMTICDHWKDFKDKCTNDIYYSYVNGDHDKVVISEKIGEVPDMDEYHRIDFQHLHDSMDNFDPNFTEVIEFEDFGDLGDLY